MSCFARRYLPVRPTPLFTGAQAQRAPPSSASSWSGKLIHTRVELAKSGFGVNLLWKHTTVYLELLEVSLEPKARKFRFQVGGHSPAPLVSKAHSGQHLTGPLLELAAGLDQAGRGLACTPDTPLPHSQPEA